MKNLFSLFALVAIFSLGSCQEDSYDDGLVDGDAGSEAMMVGSWELDIMRVRIEGVWYDVSSAEADYTFSMTLYSSGLCKSYSNLGSIVDAQWSYNVTTRILKIDDSYEPVSGYVKLLDSESLEWRMDSMVDDLGCESVFCFRRTSQYPQQRYETSSKAGGISYNEALKQMVLTVAQQ